MKEKCFELLKEQLLLQSAGGFEMFDNPISLTIDIYCEMCEIDNEQFRKKLRDIGAMVWDNYDGDIKTWRSHQDLYKRLIDTLR
jgi:hypothetical protein